MRTTRTVMIFTEVERERALLASLFNTFGKRPRVQWQPIEEGIADVVVMSVSNPSLAQIAQAQKLAKVVVFFAAEEDRPQLQGQVFVLSKHSRAREILDLIERLEAWFGVAEKPSFAANDGRAALAG
jgi:hypothetical protein